jgi:ATP-dependent DNA helicase RecG
LDLIYFKYLKAKISYRGVQRIERYPFPYAAIREALLNAIIHKQYESGIPIQISVYDDKLYIANIGRLPEDWTLENLLAKHASRPYNPNIADTFYLAGFIESWGRGIEKIFNACIEDGVPEPSYTVHPGDIMIKFTSPADRVIRNGRRSETTNETINETINRTDKVLSAIRDNNRLTREQLAEQSGISKGTLARELAILKKQNRIKRVGSNKLGYWEVIE